MTAGEVVTLQTSPGALITFVTGLVLIIIGTGFFKPCVSVMVGQLYGKDDGRRDSGFTIFYMGINLGAFLSPLVAGTLGQKVGWHWGFGSAAVGMILGLICYQFLRPKYLAGVGLSPKDIANERANGGAAVSKVDEAELQRPLNPVDVQRILVILILAGLAAIDSDDHLYQLAVDECRAAGAERDEMLGVIDATKTVIGGARAQKATASMQVSLEGSQ